VNRIESLERADGSKCESVEDNHMEVQNFYQTLYNSQGFREMDELLNFVQPEVTQQMNDGMDASYTEDEIKTALFQMAPSKAPGDGVNPTIGFMILLLTKPLLYGMV
jgi:hypothetical protein